jgi:hypothetical protein
MTVGRTVLISLALVSSFMLLACEGDATVNSESDIDIEDTQTLVPPTGLVEGSAVSTVTENKTSKQPNLEATQLIELQAQNDDIELLRSELRVLKDQIQNDQLESEINELHVEMNDLRLQLDHLVDSVTARETCIFEIARGVSLHGHDTQHSHGPVSNPLPWLEYSYSDLNDEIATELLATGMSYYFWGGTNPLVHEILTEMCGWDFPEPYGVENLRNLSN